MIRRSVMAAGVALAVLIPETTAIAQAKEGIVVHGHWTLEVRNVDGSAGERREFENALVPDGVKTLAQILTRQRSVGSWIVMVRSVSNPGMFGCSNAAILGEPGPLVPTPCAFPDLSVSLDPSLTKVVLRGTVKATLAGDITSVGTRVSAPCVAGAIDCVSPPVTFDFTSTAVKDANLVTKPLHLEKDQSVLVTVTLSFTSPAGS